VAPSGSSGNNYQPFFKTSRVTIAGTATDIATDSETATATATAT
jgi:hypothetical protein